MAILLGFLYLPLAVVVVFAFNAGSNLSWPIQGVSLRWFRLIVSDPTFAGAFKTSVTASALVALMSVLVATSAALALTRRRGWFFNIVQGFALLPAMLPPLFIAISLYTTMAQFNIATGLGPIVVGQLIVVMPFVLVIISARLQRFDVGLEEAARDLGANVPHALRRVTLPTITAAVIGAALLSFAFSFDEVLITNFTSGITTTLPIYIYSKMHRSIDPSINAVATLLMVTPWIALALAWPLLRGRTTVGALLQRRR